MKIAVCDDDRPIREELMRLIQRQVSDADITEYQSGEELLLAGADFDIYFLDIEMDAMSGMELAGHIREREENSRQRSIIIFVTGYREYMGEAFDVNAFHYLVKPVDEEKFEQVFCRAWKEAKERKEELLKRSVLSKERNARRFIERYEANIM